MGVLRLCVYSLMVQSLVVFLLEPTQVYAQGMTPEAVYARCYRQMVRAPIPTGDALYAQVKAKTLSVSDACLQVLDKAKFDQAGQLVTPADSVSKAVLKTFFDFHRTWFKTDNFLTLPSADAFPHNSDIYDVYAPAYLPTRSLFGVSVPFSEIVTSPIAYEGIKTSSGPSKYSVAYQKPYSTFEFGVGGVTDDVKWATSTGEKPIAQFGTLIGVRPIRPNILPRADGAIDIYKSFGGGTLGTRPYVLLNLGRQIGDKSDGGRIMPRRWMSAIFRDLLGRDLPVLRVADANDEVSKTSNLPFRNSVNCMACHKTMDHGASTARNITYIQSTAQGNFGVATLHVNLRTPTLEAEAGPVDVDPDFYQRPPSGRLIYRSFDGTYIDRSVANIQQLGNAFADYDDIYLNAANQYFKFFTGISVYITDFDAQTNPVSPRELEYRAFLIGLAKKLHANQDLHQLVKSILDSRYYQSYDYGFGGQK
jgi:hypothetical protein